jgi:hypothetical protein
LLQELVITGIVGMTSAKMSERKFTRGLGKPGMAAQLRETVSQVVRESTVQVQSKYMDSVMFVYYNVFILSEVLELKTKRSWKDSFYFVRFVMSV